MNSEKQSLIADGAGNHASSNGMNSEKQSLIGAGNHASSNDMEAEGASSISCDNIPKINSLTQFLELIGVGKTQYLPWIAGFFVGYADYTELFLISIIIPYLRCHWDLSEQFEAAISFCVFGSYAVFSGIIARYSDLYGRRKLLIFNSVVILTVSILAAAIDNKWAFLATRIVTGAFVGSNVSVYMAYCVELCNKKYRLVGPIISNAGSVVVIISINLQGLLLLNVVGWQWFILIVSFPLLLKILILTFCVDSPRFLLVSDRKEALYSTLQRMTEGNQINLSTYEINIKTVDHKIRQQRGSFTDLFLPQHRRNVIALSLSFFSNIFMEFGLVVLLPLILSSLYCGTGGSIPKHTCNFLTTDDFYKLILSGVAAIVAILICMGSMHKLGRLITIRISSACIAIVTVGLFFCVNEQFTFLIILLLKFFEQANNTAMWTTAPELLPTTIRSSAVGFMNAMGKFGGVLGTTAVYLLFYKSSSSLIGLFFVVQIIGFISTLVLNTESRDMELDDFYQVQEK